MMPELFITKTSEFAFASFSSYHSLSGDERSDDNRHDQFGHFFYRFLGLNICIYVIVNGTTNTFPTTT